MSARLTLRAVVNERLTAAAEEIFQVFEKTIATYEEEASSSQQEIERLRGLLRKFDLSRKTDLSQSSTSKEEQQHCEQEQRLGVSQKDPEPSHIKEEDDELWASHPHKDYEECECAGDSSVPHLFDCWETNEQEDTKPLLQPQTLSGERVEQIEDLLEAKTEQLTLPLASTSHILIQDGRENKRPATSSESQSSLITSRKSTELYHFNSVAPEYRCQLCNKTLSSNQHLVNHAFHMHSNEADVLCAVCGTTLESTERLTVHLKSHADSRCCCVCGKHFRSKASLTEHMASHAGVTHRCHFCGKECRRKGDLKIHMRIHTGEKPFCCTHCHKSFTHSGHLKKHMRSHTGERPHQCQVCGRGFLQSIHLKAHLQTHTKEY